MKPTWRVEHLPLGDLAQLREEWNRLAERAVPSYFTSWGWVEAFLQGFPPESKCNFVRIWKDGVVVGLTILGAARETRGGIIRSRAWHLLESGIDPYDELTVEHNGLLVDEQCAEEASRVFLEDCLSSRHAWDELYLSGVRCGSPLEIVAREQSPTCPLLTVKDRPYYWVDLDELRQSGRAYLSTLGSGTRSQIKRAMKFYAAEFGPLVVQEPESVDEALKVFDELVEVHTPYWQSRGHSGAFTAPSARAFHERLIRQRFETEEIQLLRISAGPVLLGVVYNFLLCGRVYSYQTGFSYSEENKKKPGLVCHTLAIEYNLERGFHSYDFLAGDHRYKLQLASHDGTMRWLKFQRPRLKFRVEGLLRTVRDATVSRLKGQYAAWKSRPRLAVAPALPQETDEPEPATFSDHPPVLPKSNSRSS
jgi:CelD/BcsL family acetyltransferase involved in cellulose biosynthesis